MKRYIILAVIAAAIGLILFSPACKKSQESEDAKKQVLEKKDASTSPLHRKVQITPINLADVPRDEAETRKLLMMTQEEAAARLGSYRFYGLTKNIVTRKGKDLPFEEKQEYEQASSGDFHLKIFNDRQLGFEMIYKDGKIYDHLADQPYRPTDSAGKQLFWREKAATALTRFYRYFRGRISFSPPLDVTYEGRPAIKILMTLDANGKPTEEDLPPTFNFPNQYALNALAIDKAINVKRKQISRVEELSGHFIIDKEKAVVVAYVLHVRYDLPISQRKKEALQAQGVADPGGEAVFLWDSTMELKEIGTPVSIKEPDHDPSPVRTTPPEDVRPLLPEGSELHPELMDLPDEKEGKDDPRKAPAPRDPAEEP